METDEEKEQLNRNLNELMQTIRSQYHFVAAYHLDDMSALNVAIDVARSSIDMTALIRILINKGVFTEKEFLEEAVGVANGLMESNRFKIHDFKEKVGL